MNGWDRIPRPPTPPKKIYYKVPLFNIFPFFTSLLHVFMEYLSFFFSFFKFKFRLLEYPIAIRRLAYVMSKLLIHVPHAIFIRWFLIIHCALIKQNNQIWRLVQNPYVNKCLSGLELPVLLYAQQQLIDKPSYKETMSTMEGLIH